MIVGMKPSPKPGNWRMTKVSEMKHAPILIATDQATSGPTGIVIARYHPVGGAHLLYAESVQGLQEIRRCIEWIAGKYERPLALGRESGFWSPKTPSAGFTTEQSGGWVEAIADKCWPGIMIRSYMANNFDRKNGWRDKLFPGSGCRTTGDWKAYVLQWARACSPLIENEHQADAFGILCATGLDLTAEGVIDVETLNILA